MDQCNWRKLITITIQGLKFIIIINLEYFVTWSLNEVHIIEEICEL